MSAATKSKKGRASSPASHPPISACLGNGIWQTASWTSGDTYEQDLNERTCTCAAGKKQLWCRHLTGALLCSYTLQVRKARAADGVVVRGLLNRGAHKGRPDIEMALLLVAWEEAQAAWSKLQADAPGDEPLAEDGGAYSLSDAEYEAGIRLLSEGRKAA